jgi:hypothetical protein
VILLRFNRVFDIFEVYWQYYYYIMDNSSLGFVHLFSHSVLMLISLNQIQSYLKLNFETTCVGSFCTIFNQNENFSLWQKYSCLNWTNKCLVYPMLTVSLCYVFCLFVFVLCLVYPMLTVSLCCVFVCLSLFCVWCTQCWQYFCVVFFFCLSLSDRG